MKKILMRAHMSPFDNFSPLKVLSKNTIGANLGNLIFSQSMFVTLMKEDTQIDTISDFASLTAEDIKRIDEEYDAFVIPLANAFRLTFVGELNAISFLVERLTIPCVVVGVGMQAGFTTDVEQEFEFDDAVRRFMKAVLEKSAIVGIRGEYTAQYLKKLGYVEEKDFTIIGCPSMFMHGKHLPKIEKKPLTADSKVSINSKIQIPSDLHAFMERTIPLFNDYCYIPQIRDEMYLMYQGMPLSRRKYKTIPEYFPQSLVHETYAQDKSRMFVDAASWMKFLNSRDLSFGTRIHGNIAAIQSGTPAYIVASDLRVQELARYHHIPHTIVSEIKEDETLFDLYERADYDYLYEGHEERFAHFIDFLNKNKLEHIYDENLEATTNCFWEKLEEIKFAGEIHAFSAISIEEQEKRLADYYHMIKKKQRKVKTEKDEFKKTTWYQLAKKYLKKFI